MRGLTRCLKNSAHGERYGILNDGFRPSDMEFLMMVSYQRRHEYLQKASERKTKLGYKRVALTAPTSLHLYQKQNQKQGGMLADFFLETFSLLDSEKSAIEAHISLLSYGGLCRWNLSSTFYFQLFTFAGHAARLRRT